MSSVKHKNQEVTIYWSLSGRQLLGKRHNSRDFILIRRDYNQKRSVVISPILRFLLDLLDVCFIYFLSFITAAHMLVSECLSLCMHLSLYVSAV